MHTFDPLRGYTVTAIFTNDTQTVVRFKTKEGRDFVFQAEGDCCNDVWINHMQGVHNLIDGVVLFTEDKEWTPCDVTRQEYEESGFYTIISSDGYFDLEVRNSHNGYYGGSFNEVDSKSHDAEWYQTPISITDDY